VNATASLPPTRTWSVEAGLRPLLDLAITDDSVDPTRVNNFERWESREHLDAWREVADAPVTGISVRSEHVMLFVVGDVRSPFS